MSDSIMSGMWQSEAVAVAALVFSQTSLVLIVGLGLARLLRSRGPVVRSTILRAALSAALIGPAASLALAWVGAPGLLIIPRTQPPAQAKDVAIESATIPPAAARQHVSPAPQFLRPQSKSIQVSQADASDLGLTAPQSSLPTARGFEGQPPPALWTNVVVVTLWAAISGILLARLLIADVIVLRLRRRARPARASVCDLCDSISRQFGVPAPRVLVATGIPGPCLVGWLRPAILLPAGWEDAQREIFIHELAHVARRDCLWQLAAQVVAATVWFQPLMWILAGHMQRAAEEACDDRVLNLGGNRGTYVRTLADLAAGAQRGFDLAGAAVGVVGMRSAAGRRIARLLDATPSTASRLGWRYRSAIVLGTIVTAAGVALLRPVRAALGDAHGAKGAASLARHVGHVVDANGRPVAGAEVWIVAMTGLDMPVLETARTELDGRFSANCDEKSTPDKWIELQAYAPGKGVGYEMYDPDQVGEIHLQPTTRITLTLTGPDGKPLGGLHVYPAAFASTDPLGWDSSSTQHTFRFLRMVSPMRDRMGGTTAADGTITLSDLPRGMKFDIGFDDDRFANLDLNSRISLAADPVTAPVSVRLNSGAVVSGTVRYGPTGKPAAGIRVYAQATNRDFHAGGGDALTDEHGQFRITHLGAGEYNLMLSLRDGVERDWTAAAHEWVKIEPGANLNGMDFTLIKGGIVTGRVTMGDTGEPLTGTSIGSHGPDHPRSSGSVQSNRVAPDGTYRLRVPPGIQFVYVQGPLPPAYRPDKQISNEVKVEDGQAVTLDFKVPRRAGVSVNGVVIGVDGAPASGITVRALTNPRGYEAFVYAKSDAHGRFHFESLPLSAPISVHDGQWGTAEPVFFDQGKEINIQLVRRVKVTLPGLITDIDGKPIAGARVKVDEKIAVMGIGRGDPIVTGSDGRFRITDLYTDNEYTIAADADGYGEAQSKLSLHANTQELPTLKLPRADGTTGGRVVDETGKPVAGVTVNLNNGMSPKEAVTDKEGRFSFHIVPGSHHLIWIRVKEQGAVGPHANGSAGQDDIKLVLPTNEQ